MDPILRLVSRDLRTFNRSLLVVQLIFPVFLLFVAGFAYSSLIPYISYSGRISNYPQFLSVGLIGLTAMNGSLLSGTLLWVDRRHGMYEQILVGPFSRFDYAISKTLSSALIGLLGALVIGVLSYLIIGVTGFSLSGLLLALSGLFLDALLFGSIALIIASIANSLEVFEGIFNFLIIALTFVSTLLYPLDAVPKFLQYIVLCNPLTYSIDMLRYGLLGLKSVYLNYEIVTLLLEVAVALILSFRFINREPR